MPRPMRSAAVACVALIGCFAGGCAHVPRTSAPARVEGLANATPAFHFVQISDTHDGMALHRDRTRQAIDLINALSVPVCFVLHTGDFASDNLTDVSAAALSNEFARLRAPLFAVPGNHDILPRRLDETLTAYRSHLGPLASRYDTNGVAILSLYTEPLRTGIAIPGYDPIAWLERELSAHPDLPTIVVHHAPDGTDFYRNTLHDGWPAEARQRWLAALSRGRVLAILTGHFHRDELWWNELGIPVYTASSIASFWGRQGSFRIYTYENGRLSYRTVYIDDKPRDK